MNQNSQFMEEVTDDDQAKIDVRKGHLDLVILKYVARRLHLTLQQLDQKLIAELVKAPGILSYSSLALPFGDWCNLVVLADVSAKAQSSRYRRVLVSRKNRV